MFNQQVYILNTFRIILDALCIILAGYTAKYGVMYYVPDVAWQMDDYLFLASILVVMAANNYVMGSLGMYGDRKGNGMLDITLPTLQSVVVCFAIMATAVYMFRLPYFHRSFMVLFAFFSAAYMIAFKLLTQLYITYVLGKGFNTRNVLIVGTRQRGKIVRELLEGQVSWGHNLIGCIDTSSDHASEDEFWNLDNLSEIIKTKAIDEIIFAIEGDRSVNLSEHLTFCRKVGVSVKILPALWNPQEHKLYVDSLQGVPFFTMQTTNFNANGILYKRVMDLLGGLVGCTMLMLMYPIITLVIKMDSPGPVIFSQKRVGLNGRVFNVFKFRTMYRDAEQRKQELMEQNEMNGAMFKMENDPRITKVGDFLRKTSLDEFPQFINVLKGEMSLVGTRPPTLDEVKVYEPWHLKRISGKPGITGLWQVSGRNKITDFDEVVRLDCQYLDKWRLLDDIKILFRTVSVVLKRKGAV
ncbi:MAG: sugar transferase [Desulfobacterales bacterium]|nr:sugar transferase [Desulfobacterales bacterium]